MFLKFVFYYLIIKYIEKLTEHLLISLLKAIPIVSTFNVFLIRLCLKNFLTFIKFSYFHEYNNVFSMSLNNLRLIQI